MCMYICRSLLVALNSWQVLIHICAYTCVCVYVYVYTAVADGSPKYLAGSGIYIYMDILRRSLVVALHIWHLVEHV